MKNMLKNKKGFTLVELLAVIVILALLIVITATTILPMLGRTKQTGMTTYAKRVLNNALTSIEADKIVAPLTADKKFYYEIEDDLTNNNSYFGCVEVDYVHSTGKFTYAIKMFTTKDKLYMQASGITDVTELGTVTFKDLSADTLAAITSSDVVEDVCDTKFANISDTKPAGA